MQCKHRRNPAHTTIPFGVHDTFVKMALVDVAPYVRLGCYMENVNSDKTISDFEYRDFKVWWCKGHDVQN